jgi:CheY-like chemotaxis protein
MSHRSILIVDDDIDIREILAETLGQSGFEVTTAGNGVEALAALRRMKTRPAAILLDLMMPIMDGYTFLEQRSSDPALASIPIAIVTAGHRIDRARLGDELPILRKPFDVPQLLCVLEMLSAEGRPAR